jgi:hypothetical protein
MEKITFRQLLQTRWPGEKKLVVLYRGGEGKLPSLTWKKGLNCFKGGSFDKKIQGHSNQTLFISLEIS